MWKLVQHKVLWWKSPQEYSKSSVLEPFLFSVAIRSLKVSYKDCHIVKYADNITIIMLVFKDGYNPLVSNTDEEILKWSEDFDLPLGLKNCKCLTIPKDTSYQEITLPHIERVEKFIILGVTLNWRYTWTDHINKVARNGAPSRLFPSCSQITRESLEIEECVFWQYAFNNRTRRSSSAWQA